MQCPQESADGLGKAKISQSGNGPLIEPISFIERQSTILGPSIHWFELQPSRPHTLFNLFVHEHLGLLEALESVDFHQNPCGDRFVAIQLQSLLHASGNLTFKTPPAKQAFRHPNVAADNTYVAKTYVAVLLHLLSKWHVATAACALQCANHI